MVGHTTTYHLIKLNIIQLKFISQLKVNTTKIQLQHTRIFPIKI